MEVKLENDECKSVIGVGLHKQEGRTQSPVCCCIMAFNYGHETISAEYHKMS